MTGNKHKLRTVGIHVGHAPPWQVSQQCQAFVKFCIRVEFQSPMPCVFGASDNAGLNPVLDPTLNMPSPWRRKDSNDSSASLAAGAPSLGFLDQQRQQQQQPGAAPQPPKQQVAAQRLPARGAAAAAGQSAGAAHKQRHAEREAAPLRRSLSFDTGRRCVRLSMLS